MTDAPCAKSAGSTDELVQKYLSTKSYSRVVIVSKNVYVSSIDNISLKDYILARRSFCMQGHSTDCTECDSLLMVAQSIVDDGYVIMSEAFRKSFPTVKYTAEIARRKFLQMPLVNIIVGDPSSGKSRSYLLESRPGSDYNAIHQILSVQNESSKHPGITKETFKEILTLAQSDRERELIRYTAFVSGQFSRTSARKQLGFDDMKRRAAEVERCIKETKDIKEAIDEIVHAEIRSIAINRGLSSSEDDCDSDSEVEETDGILTDEVKATLVGMLRESMFNWFEFLSQIENHHELSLDTKILCTFYSSLLTCGLTEK